MISSEQVPIFVLFFYLFAKTVLEGTALSTLHYLNINCPISLTTLWLEERCSYDRHHIIIALPLSDPQHCHLPIPSTVTHRSDSCWHWRAERVSKLNRPRSLLRPSAEICTRRAGKECCSCTSICRKPATSSAVEYAALEIYFKAPNRFYMDSRIY